MLKKYPNLFDDCTKTEEDSINERRQIFEEKKKKELN